VRELIKVLILLIFNAIIGSMSEIMNQVHPMEMNNYAVMPEIIELDDLIHFNRFVAQCAGVQLGDGADIEGYRADIKEAGENRVAVNNAYFGGSKEELAEASAKLAESQAKLDSYNIEISASALARFAEEQRMLIERQPYTQDMRVAADVNEKSPVAEKAKEANFQVIKGKKQTKAKKSLTLKELLTPERKISSERKSA
jgi:hypothetical protein